VPTPDLVAVAGFASGRAMGGLLARVVTRCRNRFGLEFPFEAEWDDDIGHARYTMEKDIAEIVLRVL
jgi:hypothetical protein